MNSMEVPAYRCGKCLTSWGERDLAEACCAPRTCATCGAPCTLKRCSPCESAHEAKLEQEAFGKAKHVQLGDYTGVMLYRDGYGNDGCFDPEEPPEGLDWAWSCSTDRASLDLDQTIREDALQEHHEAAHEQVDWSKSDWRKDL